MRHETKRRLPLRRGRRGAGGAALLRAQPSGRRPGCSGLPARRHADLRDARAAGPERRRRLSGGPLAGRALAGLVRRAGAGADARRLCLGLGQDGVLRGKPVRERVPVLRRHVVSQPRRRARVGTAQGRAPGVGAAGVVAAAKFHDGARGRDGAVAVRAPSGDPPERDVTQSFHPYLLDRRWRVARNVVWAVLGVVMLAFFRTQILEHGKYQLQSETNRLRPIPLPAPRGIITDRNGKVIAENVPGYTVALLPSDESTIRAALLRVASIVKLDNRQVERVLARYRRAPYLPALILSDAKFDVVSQLEEHRLLIPGLLIQPEPKRHYPDSTIAAHLAGAIGEVTEGERAQRRFAGVRLGGVVGKDGLEREYD